MDNKQIRAKAKTYGVPIIRTKSHEILQGFVKYANPMHILEIGMAVGYSGIAMLEVSSADLVTIEHNADFIKQAKKNFISHGLKNRVSIVKGDCLVALAKMVASKRHDNYFDFIFLDGPKAQYEQMLELLLLLLAPDGTLVVDNVLFRGYVEGENQPPTKRYKTIIKRLNNFIEKCKNHPKLVNFELNSTEDGLIFAKKVKDEK